LVDPFLAHAGAISRRNRAGQRLLLVRRIVRPEENPMRIRSLLPLALLALAACIPSPPEPTPAPQPLPTPTPPPVPAPAPAPPPFVGNWNDAPQTPGDWTYRTTATGSTALFGQPGGEARLTLNCRTTTRIIELSVFGATAATGPIVVRTETRDNQIAGQLLGGEVPGVGASIPAHDPLLDAMAFSRGRFAIEAAGLPALHVPSYPEVTRVIEDCR
jgi:hypothetical protein